MSVLLPVTDIVRLQAQVRKVPKGDMLAKARTQLHAEPVLRLAEDKARGLHPG
jgi:hypothetical protein